MTEPTTAAPPSATPTRRGMPSVLRVIGGCLVVVLVVGVGLAAERFVDDDVLELPDRVAGVDADDTDAVLDELGADARDRARADLEAFYEFNDEQLSEAYDGAEAATRRYGLLSDATLQLLVTAVRAESGPPVPVSFDDPEALGLAAARSELVEEGAVDCLLTRANPPRADEEAEEEDLAPVVVLCQRSGGDLTVRVLGTNEPDLDAVVDATDEVWEELS